MVLADTCLSSPQSRDQIYVIIFDEVLSSIFVCLFRISFSLSIVYFNVSHQAFSTYYKGGFEQKMTKREASLILGIR